jgi:alpha-L-arabinofuranosidase
MATELYEYRLERIEEIVFRQSETLLACEKNIFESNQLNKQSQEDIKKLFHSQKNLTNNIDKHKEETDKKLQTYLEELNTLKLKVEKQESSRKAVTQLFDNWKWWLIFGVSLLAAVSSLVDAGIFEFIHHVKK